ncbi:MAG: hypothetical protein ACI9OI_002479 [Chitinophagales bacterium]
MLKSASAYIGATSLNQLVYDCEHERLTCNIQTALTYVVKLIETIKILFKGCLILDLISPTIIVVGGVMKRMAPISC